MCALGVILYYVGRAVMELAGANQHPHPEPPWWGSLPLKFFLQHAGYTTRLSLWFVLALQIIVLLQTSALCALYFVLRRVRVVSAALCVILAGAALAMLAIALSAQTMSESDLYAYVGLALAEPTAYHPNGIPFSGEGVILNKLWGLPLLPSVYGPLWIAISKGAVASGHSLAQQLAALRWVEVLALGACAAALYVLTRSVALVAIVVLNPAMYDLYVVDGHNDLTGVAFVLAAAATRDRYWLSVPLAAAAGLIKLPFILIATLAFSGSRHKFLPALGAALLALVASAAIVGPDYLWALRHVYLTYGGGTPSLITMAHVLVAVVAVAAIVFALAKNAFFPGGAWSFVAFGQHPSPWYLAWGIPYAVLSGPSGVAFFLTLPLASALLATFLPITPIVAALRLVLVAAIVTTVVLFLRYRREPT
ncbi:MAG TPA: hypothetical protein VKG44_08970 [Candidatus Baltobacteraceae bacterium]|nr:hypothetical protein [Candidatus Baltobacteraceae bacterium]